MHELDRKPPLPGFDFDPEQGLLRDACGAEVPLRPQTTAVLQLLWENAGHIVTKAQLMDSVWRDVVVTDDSLVQCIKEIRQALHDDEHRIVRTLPRRGYRLVLAQAVAAAGQGDGATPRQLPPLRFGRAELQPAQRHLLLDGQRAAVGEAAFDVLLALAERRDRVVGRNELLDLVWPHLAVADGELQAQLAVLRKLLGPDVITTVPGRGYRFSAVVFDEPQTATPEDRPPSALPSASIPNGVDPHPAEAHRFEIDTHLPDVLPPLIGRDDDLDSLDTMVRRHPLVTITGAGGMGKTRLAQHLLKREQGEFEQGVCWVELAGLSDPTLVAPTIASALGAQIGRGDPLKGLLAVLRDMSVLLALDNAEHLVEEVARVAVSLVEAGPQVRMLITSQAPLRCRGEWIFHLESLATPKAEATVDEAIGFGAVALFVERAQAADRYFELTAGNVATVVELCRRLDGLPLAIELAAARVPHLGLAKLANSLNERLRLLTAGKRGAPARQQTLRAALQWSHSLLNSAEEAVFRRLGVFAGGFGLEMAKKVVIDPERGPPLNERSVVDLLGSLVDRSLVTLQSSEPLRYGMLESAREFALGRLTAAGEEMMSRRRHASAMRLHFAEARETYYAGRFLADHMKQLLAPDLDNAREALRWAIDHDASNAVSLAPLIDHATPLHFHEERGRIWDTTAALVTEDLPDQQRAEWAYGYSRFCCPFERQKCLTWARQAVTIYRGYGDRMNLYFALGVLCTASQPSQESHAALNEMRSIEDDAWSAAVKYRGAWVAMVHAHATGQIEEGAEATQRLLRWSKESGNSEGMHIAMHSQAMFLLSSGSTDSAVALGEQLEASIRDSGFAFTLTLARAALTTAYLVRGDVDRARAVARQGWPLASGFEMQSQWGDSLALLAALEGRAGDGAQLCGYSDAVFAGYGRSPFERQMAMRAERAVRQQLGDAEFERLRGVGSILRDEDVAAVAFGSIDR